MSSEDNLRPYSYNPPAAGNFKGTIFIHPDKDGPATVEFIKSVHAFLKRPDEKRLINFIKVIQAQIADPKVDKNARLSMGMPIFHTIACICPPAVVSSMLNHAETEVDKVHKGLSALTYLATNINYRRQCNGIGSDIEIARIFQALISDPRINILPRVVTVDGRADWRGVLSFFPSQDALYAVVSDLLLQRQLILVKPKHEQTITQTLYAARFELTKYGDRTKISLPSIETTQQRLRA